MQEQKDMKKLNITLPSDLVKDLETMLDKNRFVADAVKEKLEREKGAELEELLIEGYKTTKKEDGILNKEWELITLEGWN